MPLRHLVTESIGTSCGLWSQVCYNVREPGSIITQVKNIKQKILEVIFDILYINVNIVIYLWKKLCRNLIQFKLLSFKIFDNLHK